MDEKQKFMVENYQCAGCVCGSDISCFEKSDSLACGKHVSGTTGYPAVGRFFLGLPKGFCRFSGENDIHIYKDLTHDWKYDKFNIPVWKHLDEHGNTLVRGMCPRIDSGWIHIYIGDWIAKINCLEITKTDIDEMD